MSTDKLTAGLKTRVLPETKVALEKIAELRHLDTADIVREALREYLAKHPVAQPELKMDHAA